MNHLIQGAKIVGKAFQMTTLHANTISKCQYCSCQMNTDEKMTILNNAPDAKCGRCHHKVENHLD